MIGFRRADPQRGLRLDSGFTVIQSLAQSVAAAEVWQLVALRVYYSIAIVHVPTSESPTG